MIIATRTLELRRGALPVQFAVRLFKPEQDQGAWSCRYEIDWPKGRKVSSATGADSMQALLAALHKVGIELYSSDDHKSGRLAWTGIGKGYGFPLTANVRDLLEGDDAHL